MAVWGAVTGRHPGKKRQTSGRNIRAVAEQPCHVTLRTHARGRAWSGGHFLAWLEVCALYECIARTSFLCTVPFTSCFNNAVTTLFASTFKQESLLWPLVLSVHKIALCNSQIMQCGSLFTAVQRGHCIQLQMMSRISDRLHVLYWVHLFFLSLRRHLALFLRLLFLKLSCLHIWLWAAHIWIDTIF